MEKILRWEKCPGCEEMISISPAMFKDISVRCSCGTCFEIADAPKIPKKEIVVKEEPKQEEIPNENID